MEFEDIEAPATGLTSLDLLQAIYRCPDQPLHVRMKAAIAALPFEHPRLGVTVALDGRDSSATALQGAIARSRPVLELHAAEPAPVAPNGGHDAAAVSDAALRRPMPFVSWRRR
jgi:hypothetical protein